MIIKLLIVAAILVVAFILFVASRSGDFRIARTAIISAPPPLLFEQVNDLHRWKEMSPFAKLDLAAKYHYDGPPAGEGAAVAWTGNNQIGQGRMTIAESRPNELVRMKLEFLKPFKATNTAEFKFEPRGEQTKVTWSMQGRSNFICKAVGLFMDCDKMLGAQFDEGLSNMRAIAERQNAFVQN